MKFNVKLTEQAVDNLNNLDKENYKKALKAFDIIENVDINAVVTRPLTTKIYEIKTGKVRCLFVYVPNRIIVIGIIFLKKTQKTPKIYIEKAEKELKEYTK